jgi:hypothetical protein
MHLSWKENGHGKLASSTNMALDLGAFSTFSARISYVRRKQIARDRDRSHMYLMHATSIGMHGPTPTSSCLHRNLSKLLYLCSLACTGSCVSWMPALFIDRD